MKLGCSFALARFALAALLGVPLGSGGALAQGAPVPLPPPRPPALQAPAAAAIEKMAAPPKTATMDAAGAIQRANAWFNSSPTMVADFVQIGADGRRTQGQLFVLKPGRLRFEYASPATLEIIADGTSVAVRDRKLATQDVYFISQTPLKFLLKEMGDPDFQIMEELKTGVTAGILEALPRTPAIFEPQTRWRLAWDGEGVLPKLRCMRSFEGLDCRH
jgi:outer membrane lipoprotein-sorting protein